MRKTLAILGTAVSISTLAACGGSHDASGNKNPSSLIGEWHQVNKNPDGYMTASIDDDSIQVNLRSRDSSAIFWLGTFDGTRKPVGTFKIVSLGDQDAMKYKIASSNEQKKTFTYKNGEITYEFSAMGSSTTVHLVKTKTASPTTTITNSGSNHFTAQTPKAYTTKPATPKVKVQKPSKSTTPPKVSIKK